MRSKASPIPNLEKPIHYCLESTSTYHLPILHAFQGTPSIVNPTIAGATKRKTDVLDAQLLATHNLIGIWPESYIPSTDIHELRVLVWERDRCLTDTTINNALIRFGYTMSREGSIAKKGSIRDIAEAILNGEANLPDNLCPLGIPDNVRDVIISEYQKYDNLRKLAEYWRTKAEEKVLNMQWETETSTLSGTDMLALLTTTPQVGVVTAITWLVHIVTPRRFPNGKALAAYCGLDPSLKISAKHVTSTTKCGGCKQLHKSLVSSADRLIRQHNEMFGQWGYNLYCQTGKCKKAANAVARKLAVAMYYMMKTVQPFSYKRYNLIKYLHVFDISVEDLSLIDTNFKRYIHILKEHNIETTAQLVTAYLSCTLGPVNGLGKKFFSTLRIFMNEQNKYRKLYEQLKSRNI